jgi:hypothetical protein
MQNSLITLFGYQFNVYAIIIALLLTLFLIAVIIAQRDPESEFDWTDLVMSIDQSSGKKVASASKILQLVGGATGTFIVIKLTLQNNISFDIFATYLAYVASIESFSKFMIAKYGVRGQPNYQQPSYQQPPYRGPYQPNPYQTPSQSCEDEQGPSPKAPDF